MAMEKQMKKTSQTSKHTQVTGGGPSLGNAAVSGFDERSLPAPDDLGR